MVNKVMLRKAIEATSKEDDYGKQFVNYFRSWHMGTTNKLLQTALGNLKWPSLPIVTQWLKMVWD